MMKTCTVCGVQYQTMADKGYKYCHKCAVKMIEEILEYIQPILFELSNEQLNLLTKAMVRANLHVMNDLDRRESYFANMMQQRKMR